MSEPDIEKAKKKGKRARPSYHYHARTYLNLNKPLVVNADAAVPKPPQVDECMEADVDKGAGNPVARPDGRSWTESRVSPSRVTGGAARAVDDHGTRVDPMNIPGPRELAYRHPDLRQSSVNAFDAVSRLMTVLGDNQYGDRSITHTVGQVGLDMFNARDRAGSFDGMQSVSRSPIRPASHIAPTSALPANGTHSVTNATRPPTGAMKASEAREMLKRHMFGGNGAR